MQIAIDDMRDLISSLNTLEVHRFSFKEVLQDIIRRVNEQSEIPVTLSMSEDLKLKSISPEISLHIIRLCQEAVSNAIRHAEASYISLRISTRGYELKIRITDNGKGFDQSDSNNSNGIGIISMRERVRQCNCFLKITPHKGAGTEVFASIPLREDIV
ncbi:MULTISPECIES: sensor histidine kinase [unclassified Oceanispirochaeta]|uniref:sensor histidine kinase n=1 Tax=unclassified Oceanispirochaeta TaxID=2635722 RepID=UPI001E5B98D8|nr:MULTISPECIES: ATP-binding protein [unclassified Oceanispirochaeta]